MRASILHEPNPVDEDHYALAVIQMISFVRPDRHLRISQFNPLVKTPSQMPSEMRALFLFYRL